MNFCRSETSRIEGLCSKKRSADSVQRARAQNTVLLRHKTQFCLQVGSHKCDNIVVDLARSANQQLPLHGDRSSLSDPPRTVQVDPMDPTIAPKQWQKHPGVRRGKLPPPTRPSSSPLRSAAPQSAREGPAIHTRVSTSVPEVPRPSEVQPLGSQQFYE